jgi:hypothetical protein
MLTGYLSEWAALEDKCKNEAFNSQDTSPLSWDRMYEELARWFGVEKGVVGPEEDESKYTSIKGRSGKQTPMGYALIFHLPPTLNLESLKASFRMFYQTLLQSHGKHD